jgi:hypothetical protein
MYCGGAESFSTAVVALVNMQPAVKIQPPLVPSKGNAWVVGPRVA